jgi:hypothetical protein
VLLDADDDCPAELGSSLLARARSARPDKPVAEVLPKQEFEAWFLAAAASLGGRCGLPDGLTTPDDPEGIRDAKGWLTERRIDSLRYSPTADQAGHRLRRFWRLRRDHRRPTDDLACGPDGVLQMIVTQSWRGFIARIPGG